MQSARRLRTTDDFPIRGTVRITTRDLRTGKVLEESTRHNLVLRYTREELAKAFLGIAPALTIDAISVGTGTAAPTLDDNSLVAEIGRRSGLNVEVTRLGSQVTARVFFGGSEANGRIRELGLWAGTKLLCRLNDDRSKDNSMTMTVEWTVTVGS
jgi:hypothetical protein